MNATANDDLIDKLEQRVEKHLQEAIATFQNLDTTVLLKPSATGGWSIAQCLEHLNRYGQYYLPEVKERLERQTDSHVNNGIFKSTWLGSYFTKMMEPETGKRKLPAFKEYKPPRDLDAHNIVSEFITQQETMLKLLRAARHANLNVRVPISISRWIRLKLGDVLQFVIAHNERHIKQAKRNL